MQKFVSKLSDGERKILYITVVIVFAALFDRLFLGPTLSNIRKIDEQTVEAKNNIERDLRILTHEKRIDNELKAYDQYIVSEQLEEDEVNTQFFRSIEILAKQAEVNLVKSNPSEAQKGDVAYQYYANLDITGDLKSIIDFMYLINTNTELYKIEKFNMTPKRGEDDMINASLTVAKLIVRPVSAKK